MNIINWSCKMVIAIIILLSSTLNYVNAQKKFEQLDQILPTPNSYRTASGSPGKDYYTQKADYNIEVSIDDEKQILKGKETINYRNNSPNTLTYLWVQLDQNIRKKNSDNYKTKTESIDNSKMTAYDAKWKEVNLSFDGGFKISNVTDTSGNKLKYAINKTMMRIDIPKNLKPESNISFNIEWSYKINDRMLLGGRSGYEYFPKDKNYLYAIAQFYPRMCAYTDKEGWQNKQFLGNGEFALTFGDFKVSITMPSDYVVASTGLLQNVNDVLTPIQKKRYEMAKKTYDKPIFIITEEEAIQNEKSKKSNEMVTWIYKAENVRDFAFVASRKFIWDAQAVKLKNSNNVPLAMSYYPKEGNPLWEKVSTKAIKNTLEVYSKYTFPYPYPVAISVHTASIGMEYPMICFNWGRPKDDGTYSKRVKYRTIGVIIHEIGHNYFPMIVNSDERQWTWMDEGLNSFLQYRTEVERYENFPSRRGPTKKIIDYMKGDKKYIKPIMTNSEQIIQFGNNSYGKPATALNILRETVMGHKLFDMAFKEYVQRWKYKSPEPADFFRTMEDASAIDLDWFWRGWFYSTDHTDIQLNNVRLIKIADNNETATREITEIKNPFNEKNKKITTINVQIENPKEYQYSEFRERINNNKIKNKFANANMYELALSNLGGLVMPVIIKWDYIDGTSETQKLPAEVWRKNDKQIIKTFFKKKKVVKVTIDPDNQTADVNTQNNTFPRTTIESDYDKFLNK